MSVVLYTVNFEVVIYYTSYKDNRLNNSTLALNLILNSNL